MKLALKFMRRTYVLNKPIFELISKVVFPDLKENIFNLRGHLNHRNMRNLTIKCITEIKIPFKAVIIIHKINSVVRCDKNVDECISTQYTIMQNRSIARKIFLNIDILKYPFRA